MGWQRAPAYAHRETRCTGILPGAGNLWRGGPYHIGGRCGPLPWLFGMGEEELSCAAVPRRAPRLAQRHHAGTLPQRACQGCLESDDVVSEKMLRWGLGPTANLFNL